MVLKPLWPIAEPVHFHLVDRVAARRAVMQRKAKHGLVTAAALAALRSAYPTLELLPSLDELRERITLHLSAARPGQVPAFVGGSVAAAARRADEPVAEHPDLRGAAVRAVPDQLHGSASAGSGSPGPGHPPGSVRRGAGRVNGSSD